MKRQKSTRLTHKFSSYIAVGLTAFLTEYLSFFVLITVMTPLVLAQTISFSLGLMVSFYGNRKHTFSVDSDYVFTGRSQLSRYVSLALFNLILSNILIYFLVEYVVIEPIISKIIVIGIIVTWNYTIFSKYIFKAKQIIF
ncbi:GtrA family protein [Candidatus Saccharibacteria bacterium]|nr:GtrA family protein [Candidatus Saccharibacteria bacterium]